MDRAMTSLRHMEDGYNGERGLWKYMAVSFVGHLLVMGVFLYWPAQKSDQIYLPEVINVRMVTMPEPKANRPGAKAKAVVKKPAPAAKPQAKPDAVALGKKKKAAPVKPKTKMSLKHRTFKSNKVLRSAIKELERKVETAPPEPLAETLKRLREKVASEKAQPLPETGVRVGDKRAVNTIAAGKGKGKAVSDLLTVYRVEIAYQVQKHWAFSPQLAGNSGNLTTGVIFKVLPDGEITDIIITDHSGNAYLDESARKAILKSSPVSPHPAGLNMPYVTVGLRFTPEGVK